MDDHKKNLVHLSDKIVADGELVFWHEDYEVSAKHALKVGETYVKVAPGAYFGSIESFHRAVALYAAASMTKQRKYWSAGNKIRKRISALAKHGNTTLQYYSIFLMAEHLALKKKYKEAKMTYEEALQAVGELGHLHHLGLFNERYSDFLLRELGLGRESRSRLEEAIRYYKEWGAVHKVKALESRL
jgi:tetratricopeptide (TPR) repeat protein